MKKILFIIILILFALQSQAQQYSGSFFVGGDLSTFYPVVFQDVGWDYAEATKLSIGRSSTHLDGSWRGSLLASFKVHVSRWGHGSNFIDADIKQHTPNTKTFIAGWQDASYSNNDLNFIIWLRGNTTYYFSSNYGQAPSITIGSVTLFGTTYEPKTAVDTYVNNSGMTYANNIWSLGARTNFFEGDVKIGKDTERKLDVNGTIRAKEVKIEATGWSDYVFGDDYALPSLTDVEDHITTHKHLPDIPSEKEVLENGVNVVEMQAKLLQKIEELTLYVIEQNKRIETLEKENNNLKIK